MLLFFLHYLHGARKKTFLHGSTKGKNLSLGFHCFFPICKLDLLEDQGFCIFLLEPPLHSVLVFLCVFVSGFSYLGL